MIYAKIKDVKILTLCYEYPPIGGGGGKVVAGLSQELVRQGEQVDVLTMHYDNLPLKQMIDGVHLIRVPAIRRRKDICTPLEMGIYLASAYPIARRLIRQNKYDLIHAHFIFPDGALAYFISREAHLPYILTAHGSDVPGYNPHRFRVEHRLLLPFWKRVVKGSAKIVTASNRLAELIHQHLPQHPIERIGNAYTPITLSVKQKNPLHILVFTRLFERKGIQYFIKALDGETTPYQVDIVGSGPYQSTLEKLTSEIQTAAKIAFHGWLDHEDARLWQLMETTAIFVLPSEEENFPMVLLEAMAAGMAIITTGHSGCAEVVGESGILIPPRDVQAIRDALRELQANPQKIVELGTRARERVENMFSWQKIAETYRVLYQKVLNHDRSTNIEKKPKG